MCACRALLCVCLWCTVFQCYGCLQFEHVNDSSCNGTSAISMCVGVDEIHYKGPICVLHVQLNVWIKISCTERTHTHTHAWIRANRWIWMLRRMKKNIIIMVHRYYVHQYNRTHTQSTFSYTSAFRIDVKEVDRTQAKDSTINNNNKNGCCCCCCTKYTNFNEFLCGLHWHNGDFLFVIMNISTNFIF